MKKGVKSQAALEFLTTYAWAFLSIIITIGALYYFGIFDFSKFLPQKCQFPSQFECLDFSFVATPDSQVRFMLVNNLGEPIDIKSYKITNDASDPLTCTDPDTISNWIAGEERDFTFTACTAGAFIQKVRAEAQISMTYCAPATTGCLEGDTVDHTFNGKITAVVT